MEAQQTETSLLKPNIYEMRVKNRDGSWTPFVLLGGGLVHPQVEVRIAAHATAPSAAQGFRERALQNATLIADILNRRPAMNAGLVESYAAWSREVYDLMGAMAAAQANDADSEASLPAGMTDAPERIWLDIGGDLPEGAKFGELHDVTWSKDNATGHGIEYVRADCAPVAPALPSAWRRRIDAAADAMSIIQASNNLGKLEAASSRALEGLRAIQANAPMSGCELGCSTGCKAKQHGCASECPALPWQPAAAPAAAVPSDAHPAVDHAHELLRRLGYHRDGDHFVNVNRAGAEAMHISTIATIVHAALLAAPTPAVRAEGVHKDPYPQKCPITGRPYFMTLSHPELGMVPTYGGPYDSYTIPAPEGEPTDPRHERELRSERYDHDAGDWVEGGEPVPLRIVHEDALFKLEAAREDEVVGLCPHPSQQQAAQGASTYSIDADPHGIRARVADAITGALAFGAQGCNPPPEGHWLTPFWESAKAGAQQAAPAGAVDALTRAARDVLAERQRQISAEGWTPEHDDEHDEGELSYAAAGYAVVASDHLQAISTGIDGTLTMDDDVRIRGLAIPWPAGWKFKPCPPRRALVKAGALILAEMERLDRAAMAAKKGPQSEH